MVMKWAIMALVVIGAVNVLLTEEYIPDDDIVVGELQADKGTGSGGKVIRCKESKMEK